MILRNINKLSKKLKRKKEIKDREGGERNTKCSQQAKERHEKTRNGHRTYLVSEPVYFSAIQWFSSEMCGTKLQTGFNAKVNNL